MWTRGAKVKHLGLHLRRDFGRWFCVSYQSCSSTGRPLAYLRNSVTEAELCLVGIDHVSIKSVEHVRHVIRQYKPNVVAVELCQKRAELLTDEKQIAPSWRDIFSMKGSLKSRLVHYVINSFYEYIANADKDPLPGSEMRVAVEEGFAVEANIMFMDKDINLTLSRIAEEISLGMLLKHVFKSENVDKQYPNMYRAAWKINNAVKQHLFEDLSMKELREHADALFEPGVIEECIKCGDMRHPGLMRAFLHERDRYMVAKLRKTKGKVVGVVGALHLPGMCELWQVAENRVVESNASSS